MDEEISPWKAIQLYLIMHAVSVREGHYFPLFADIHLYQIQLTNILLSPRKILQIKSQKNSNSPAYKSTRPGNNLPRDLLIRMRTAGTWLSYILSGLKSGINYYLSSRLEMSKYAYLTCHWLDNNVCIAQYLLDCSLSLLHFFHTFLNFQSEEFLSIQHCQQKGL